MKIWKFYGQIKFENFNLHTLKTFEWSLVSLLLEKEIVRRFVKWENVLAFKVSTWFEVNLRHSRLGKLMGLMNVLVLVSMMWSVLSFVKFSKGVRLNRGMFPWKIEISLWLYCFLTNFVKFVRSLLSLATKIASAFITLPETSPLFV